MSIAQNQASGLGVALNAAGKLAAEWRRRTAIERRVGVVETALHDLINENLQQDSRRERPALQRASAVLFRRGA